MKIGRMLKGNEERIGVVTDDGTGPKVLDLTAATRALNSACPPTLYDLIAAGKAALEAAYDTLAKARRDGDAQWFTPLPDTTWLIPITDRAVLCAGRNFGRHLEESIKLRSAQSMPAATGFHTEFPTGFLKMASNLRPHNAAVECPADVAEFDYEVEAVAILGTAPPPCVPEDKALSHVFGYTVFNDLSARDWQRKEMRNQLLLLGKNFPGFGPIGPWILTADEVPDPAALVLDLKVNGEQRQHESCADMLFSFAQLIACWSRAGLRACDMIASGTPAGVAVARKPDPSAYYLKPGDVVHASVEQIGTLETRIVAAG